MRRISEGPGAPGVEPLTVEGGGNAHTQLLVPAGSGYTTFSFVPPGMNGTLLGSPLGTR